MHIKRITEIEDVLRIVPIEVKLREKEKAHVKTKELLTFVQGQLTNPLFYLVFVYEDETEQNLAGYMALLAIPYNLMDMKSISILRVYYDPKYKHTDIKDVLWRIIEEVAKIYHIKKVRGEVSRGAKVFQRKYKFKMIKTVLERRL